MPSLVEASFTVALAVVAAVVGAALVGAPVVGDGAFVVGDEEDEDLLLLPQAASAKAATPTAASVRIWD
jgi:hypothetical protein